MQKCWLCKNRETFTGSCITNFHVDTHINIISIRNHQCATDATSMQVKEVVHVIKRRVEAHSNEPQTVVLRDELTGVTDEAALMGLQSRNTILRDIYRYQNKPQPLIPKSLRKVVIQAPYDVMLTNARFLLHDTGEHDVS